MLDGQRKWNTLGPADLPNIAHQLIFPTRRQINSHLPETQLPLQSDEVEWCAPTRKMKTVR